MTVKHLNMIIVFFLFYSITIQIAIKSRKSDDSLAEPDFISNSRLSKRKGVIIEDESNDNTSLFNNAVSKAKPPPRALFVSHIKDGDLDGKCVMISGISSFLILILVTLIFLFVCFKKGSNSITDDEGYFPSRKLTDYIESKRRKKIRLVERNKAKTRRLTMNGIKDIMREHGKQRTFEIVNRVLEDNGCLFQTKRTLFDKEYDNINTYLEHKQKQLKDDLSPTYLLGEVKKYMQQSHGLNINEHKVLLLNLVNQMQLKGSRYMKHLFFNKPLV